ncbi:MAG: type II secretion system protein [Acidobacteria bacterium]|nr:type II secretion system protein [Acidobacteriota bacterium]
MTRRRAGRDERGTTLVEVLVAVAIMGVAFTSILGGIATSIMASDMQRKEATAETVLRSYSEAVRLTAYSSCAAAYSAVYSPPSGFETRVLSIEYWESGTTFQPTCAADTGLQRLTLEARSTDGKASETVQILKRRE